MRKKPRIAVSVHPAGGVVVLLALLFLPSDQVLAALCALLWHELSHAAAFLGCGCPSCSIELTPFGGMADVKAYEHMPPLRQLLCALAGIAGSAAGAAASWLLLKESRFGSALFQGHVSLAVVNCLPAWPLDGARALVTLAGAFGRENAMRRLLSAAAVLLGMTMAAAALYGAVRGWFNPSLLFAGPYLCYASRMGLAAQQIRKMGESGLKLRRSQFMETQVLACRHEEITALFPKLLGLLGEKRYGLLFQVDDEGSVQRVWTEEEMLAAAIGEETIGAAIK